MPRVDEMVAFPALQGRTPGATPHFVGMTLGTRRTVTEREQRLLENLISEVPTGEVRNKICDANIHLRAAVNALFEASELLKAQRKEDVAKAG